MNIISVFMVTMAIIWITMSIAHAKVDIERGVGLSISGWLCITISNVWTVGVLLLINKSI